MNTRFVSAVVVVVKLGGLAMTNPKQGEFIAYMKESAKPAGSDSGVLNQVGTRIIRKAAGLDAKLNVSRDDHIVFSLVTYSGVRSSGFEPIKYLGIGNMYIGL